MFPESLQWLYQDFCFERGWDKLKQTFREHRVPFDDSLPTALKSAVTLADLAQIEDMGNRRFASEDITAMEAYGLPILDALGISKESLHGLTEQKLKKFQQSVRSALHIMQDGFKVR